MMLQYPPPEWGPNQIAAFDVLMNAVREAALYRQTLAALGINAGALITRRNELESHITGTLGPAFRDTPPGT